MTSSLDDLWDWDDPAASERAFRSAVAGADPVGRLAALTRVARALGLQGRYDEGHALLDEVAREASVPTDPAHVPALALEEVAVRIELERGRLRRSAGDPDHALAHFDTAASAAERAGLDALRVDALHMVALVGTPAEQLVRGRRALEVARSSADPGARRWEAALLNNIGLTQHDLGDLPGALATFEEALAVRQDAGDARAVQVAEWMVAWTMRLLGRTSEALAIQRRLKTELNAAGTDDAYVDEELAALSDPPPA